MPWFISLIAIFFLCAASPTGYAGDDGLKTVPVCPPSPIDLISTSESLKQIAPLSKAIAQLKCPGKTSCYPVPQLQEENWTHEVIVGPRSPEATPDWLEGMKEWREQKITELKSDGVDDINAIFKTPDGKKAQTDFVQTQIMFHDLSFYDPISGKYKVDRLLDDYKKRYGGVDSVLLWPSYPNLGIDDRNQYDLARDLPGGIAALKQMVADFHKRGVRVFWPLNPWDHGTRDEGKRDSKALALLLKQIGADGFNGDTMTAPEKEYHDAGDAISHPITIEPEVCVGDNLKALTWTSECWGYWYDYEKIPGVDRYKWIQPQHRTHVNDRWELDRTDDLQNAWFNGQGYESWENVWGIWNGITPRDGAAIKHVYLLSRALHEQLSSPDWQPFVPVEQDGIYASQFPLKGQTLWTVVNRSSKENKCSLIQIPYHGQKFFDLWNGKIIVPEVHGSVASVTVPIERDGYGAILATDQPASPALKVLLSQSQKLAATPLQDLSGDWIPVPQKIVPINSSPRAKKVPPGMVLIPENQKFQFKVSGMEIEHDLKEGVDVQYPWEKSAVFTHDKVIPIAAFYMDKEPVSNADFARFLKASHYVPKDPHNFLKDWINGVYPPGAANRAVTWVSLEDSRAYAQWAGKRLPHDWEWQYAAQGTDGRMYPWGNTMDSNAIPRPETGRVRTLPEPNGRFPQSASPFGVQDLVGDVWQWTDEFQDPHTRSAVIRGGSSYQPQSQDDEGRNWYFPNRAQLHKKEISVLSPPTLDEHGKYLLMSPSLDRSGTIGFRCVKDAAQ